MSVFDCLSDLSKCIVSRNVYTFNSLSYPNWVDHYVAAELCIHTGQYSCLCLIVGIPFWWHSLSRNLYVHDVIEICNLRSTIYLRLTDNFQLSRASDIYECPFNFICIAIINLLIKAIARYF